MKHSLGYSVYDNEFGYFGQIQNIEDIDFGDHFIESNEKLSKGYFGGR